MVQVKIADLRPAFGVNWADLDHERVEQFRKILDAQPPVVVFKTPRGLYLVEGHHRLAAAQLEGRETIEADVMVGSHRDLLRYVTDADRARAREQGPEPVEEYFRERYGPKAWGVQHIEQQFRLLRARLASDESTLAESRGYAAHQSEVQAKDLIRAVTGPGNAVLVTDRRVLWVAKNDERWVRELPYSEVTSYTEVMHGHRHAFLIEHAPSDRVEWVPAHRFFMWSWGNAEGVRSISQSFLAFSHRETSAARAIRSQLQAHEVPARAPKTIPKDPRARSSRAVAILVRRGEAGEGIESAGGNEDEA